MEESKAEGRPGSALRRGGGEWDLAPSVMMMLIILIMLFVHVVHVVYVVYVDVEVGSGTCHQASSSSSSGGEWDLSPTVARAGDETFQEVAQVIPWSSD